MSQFKVMLFQKIPVQGSATLCGSPAPGRPQVRRRWLENTPQLSNSLGIYLFRGTPQAINYTVLLLAVKNIS